MNGKVFDCYSPSSGSARNIAGEIQGKIDKEQTERVVLNLSDSPVDISKMNAQLHDWPNPGLKEVIAIDKDGNIQHLYP
ncbi:CdiA C-terminal domain-containing protein [Streptomyces lydicus]|uniref:CdiA C-terminal domain-containing protein n=1 Tax=Streptomyces lydicus TaxID=47763 RepID=UPI00378F3650